MSARLDGVPGAADRRHGSHPWGRQSRLEQGWLGSNGAALGFHPGIAAALPSRKAEGERGGPREEGDDKRVPPVDVAGKNDDVGAGIIGMRGRAGRDVVLLGRPRCERAGLG